MKNTLLAVVLLGAFGCATTEFQSSWRNPEAGPLRLTGQKVAAVFVTHDVVLRRHAEEALAREISARGAVGVPAYTFLADREIRDPEAAKARAEEVGCAGAVVMRIVGGEVVYRHRPWGPVVWVGPPYRHFWGGYWGWGWGSAWQPAIVEVDRIVKIETLVYSLRDDQLVWAGVSRTFDPGHIDDLIGELAAAVSDRMAKDGVFARRLEVNAPG